MARPPNIFATTVTYAPTTPTMANPNTTGTAAVPLDEPNWNKWVRAYQSVFVIRNEEDDHNRMSRRHEIESAFQEADTLGDIAKRILDIQAKHYQEDQRIGAIRYEENIRSHRHFFMHLAKQCGVDVLEEDLPLKVSDHPVPTTSRNRRDVNSTPFSSQTSNGISTQDYASMSSDRPFPAPLAGMPTDPQNGYFFPKPSVPAAPVLTVDTPPQMGYDGIDGQLPLLNGLTNGIANGPQGYATQGQSPGSQSYALPYQASPTQARPSKSAKTHAAQSPASAPKLTVDRVPADVPIVEYPGKSGQYYILACPHCPGRRFTGAHGLYAHLNQSDEAHAAMIASDKSFKNAVKIAGTRVVEATKAQVDAHNMGIY